MDGITVEGITGVNTVRKNGEKIFLS